MALPSSRGCLTAGLAVLLLGATSPRALAAKTERVSISSSGAEGNGNSGDAAITGNGRIVVLASDSSNLVRGDSNGARDIFVHDTTTATTTLVSLSNTGALANEYSRGPEISRQGRRVAFISDASNLVANDTNGSPDAFLRDLEAGTTTRVSLGPGNTQFVANNIQDIAIAEDASHVAFIVTLIDGQGIRQELYVRDVKAGTTTLESKSNAGVKGQGVIFEVAMSANARSLAFDSDARNLAPNVPAGSTQVYLRDRTANRLSVASVKPDGRPSTGDSNCPVLSPDGRTVVFCSNADDLVPGLQGNERYLPYLRDLARGKTTLLDILRGKRPQSDVFVRSISGDSRYVVLDTSEALVPIDTNGQNDLYVFDRETGTSVLASARSNGKPVKDPGIAAARIAFNGRAVVFDASSPSLVSGDTNNERDVFVRRLPPPTTP